MLINLYSDEVNTITFNFRDNGMGSAVPSIGDTVSLTNVTLYTDTNTYILSSDESLGGRAISESDQNMISFPYNEEYTKVDIYDWAVYDITEGTNYVSVQDDVYPTGAFISLQADDEIMWLDHSYQLTLNIAEDYPDLTVEFNGVPAYPFIYSTNVENETVNWSVSATGYTTATGTWIAAGIDSIDVTLYEQPTFTFQRHPSITDTGFNIVLVGTKDGESLEVTGIDTVSIVVDANTTVTATYSKTGYQTETQQYSVGTTDVTQTFLPTGLINDITINATPSTAQIEVTYYNEGVASTETATGSITIQADYGSRVIATGSLDGYADATLDFIVTQNATKSLVLEAKPQYTLQLSGTYTNPYIELTYTLYGEEITEVINDDAATVSVDSGTQVSWLAYAQNYAKSTGTSATLTADTTEDVTLVLLPAFTINVTPSTAQTYFTYRLYDQALTTTVTGNATLYVDRTSTLTWETTATGYISQSGSATVSSNVTQNVVLEEAVEPVETHSIQINATPADAEISITYISGGTSATETAAGTIMVLADNGTTYTYSVSASGYVTQSNSATVSADVELNVTLQTEYTHHTISFDVSPNSAYISITYVNNGVQNTLTAADSLTVSADEGSAYSWRAYADGYVTQTGSGTLTADVTRQIELVYSTEIYTLTISSVPTTALISITYTIGGTEQTSSGYGTKSVSVDDGCTYTYTVSQSGYVTVTGSNTITDDTSFTVNLTANALTYSGDTSIPAASSGRTYTITVRNPYGSGDFSVDYSGVASWFTQVNRIVVSPGIMTITYSASENTSQSSRSTSFTVSATDATAVVVRITQAASSAVTTISVSPQTTTIASGDNSTKSITWSSTSSGTWSYNSSSVPSWIHISNVTNSGDGRLIIAYYADDNTGNSSRTWSVTGTQGSQSATATVTQLSPSDEQSTPSVSVNKTTLSSSGDTFTVTASCTQTINSWSITVSPTAQVRSITYNGNVATVRVEANTSDSLITYSLVWRVNTSAQYSGTISLIQGQSLSLAGGPIWKEVGIAVEATSGEFTEYHITDTQDTILYAAKAYPEPSTTAASVVLNDICENYLGNGITFTAGVQTIPDYYKSFKFVTDTGSETSFAFYNSWAYKEIPDSQLISEPIDTTVDIRQWIPISWLSVSSDNLAVGDSRYTPRASVGGNTLMLKASSLVSGSSLQVDCDARPTYGDGNYPIVYHITSECGDYVLYYCNAYGGWDALLLRGNNKKTDQIESFNYRKKAQSSVDFSKTKYINRITPTWSLKTGYFVDGEKMYHLVESPIVYLHILATDEIIPVIVTDTSVEYLTYGNNGKTPVSYEINVEESHLKFRK